jgi:hypothetical protein
MANADDPLALGQRVVAILETGARVATYKLATLTALMDFCLENLPDDPGQELEVPLRDLAGRVIELYWHQVRPFENQSLRQSTGSSARILREVVRLRERAGAGDGGTSAAVAISRVPGAYESAVSAISLVLVRQPVHRLQKLPNGTSEPFLYDDSWMHDKVSARTIAAHGEAIRLFPGVAFALARLSGLLRPTLELLWVEDVRRMNKWLEAEVPDVAGHLFGRERAYMAPARGALRDAFGPSCFYCAAALPRDNPVDHVLPWSRVGIDGLANLVLACRSCNSDKQQSLPSLPLVTRALERDRATLEQVATSITWPTQYDRVVAAARGIYRGEPKDAATWNGYRNSVRLDTGYAPGWLKFDLGHSVN